MTSNHSRYWEKHPRRAKLILQLLYLAATLNLSIAAGAIASEFASGFARIALGWSIGLAWSALMVSWYQDIKPAALRHLIDPGFDIDVSAGINRSITGKMGLVIASLYILGICLFCGATWTNVITLLGSIPAKGDLSGLLVAIATSTVVYIIVLVRFRQFWSLTLPIILFQAVHHRRQRRHPPPREEPTA